MDDPKMRIRVQFPAVMHLEGLKSGREVEVPIGTTIEELLTSSRVKREHLRYIIAIVNGNRRSLSYRLRDREELKLVLPVGGG